MASINERIDKAGVKHYDVKVYVGRDANGKCKFENKTFTPEGRKSEKALQQWIAKEAAAFEAEVKGGRFSRKGFTVADLCKAFLEDQAVKNKPKTVEDYERLAGRVCQALGHIPLDKLRPDNIQDFYSQLSKEGIRQDGKFVARQALLNAVPQGQRTAFAARAGISQRTAAYIWAGKAVSGKTVQKVSHTVGMTDTKAFREVSEKKTLTVSTIRHYHSFLSSMFSYAVKMKLIAENPCERVTPPRAEPSPVRGPDLQEVQTLLAALQAHREEIPVQYRVITQLAIYTGARRGELCALRWSDINLDDGFITIQRSIGWVKGQLLFKTTKGQRGQKTGTRCVCIGASMIQLLREYRTQQRLDRLMMGSQWHNTVEIMGKTVKNDLLFTKPDGSPIDPNGVTRWYKEFTLALGFPPDTHFHGLRHTNATVLISDGTAVTAVSSRLGHAQTSTTTNIYADVIQSANAKAAADLDRVFDSLQPGQEAPSLWA